MLVRCSISIFVPIAISSVPPKSSARRLRRFPTLAPRILPKIENRKETKPMTEMEMSIDCKFVIPKHAKEMPIARASMLVAIASVNITISRVGENPSFSSEAVKCS